MVQTYEEILAKNRARSQTPNGVKSRRISKWKYQGIIVEGDDWNWFYEIFIATTHCQKGDCGKELTTDRHLTHSTRCVDHDHEIKNEPNVRYVCCHACNMNDNSRNTSGEPNICYLKRDGCWRFEKIINGRRYTKNGFETFEEAVQYKILFLKNLLV